MAGGSVWVGDGDLGARVGVLRAQVDDEFRMLLGDVLAMFDAVERSHAAQRAIAAEVAGVVTPAQVRSLTDEGYLSELAHVISVAEEMGSSRDREAGLLRVASALDRLAVLVQANDSLQQRLRHLEDALHGHAPAGVGMLPVVHLRECADLVDDVCVAIRAAGGELDAAFAQALSATRDNLVRLRDAIREPGLGPHVRFRGVDDLLGEADDNILSPLREGAERSPDHGLADAIEGTANGLRVLAAELELVADAGGDVAMLEALDGSYTTVEERRAHAVWAGGLLAPAFAGVAFEDSVHSTEWFGDRDEDDL